MDFLEEDEAYIFIDDASFLEVLNIVSAGLSSYNSKLQVPSDLSADEHFLSTDNCLSQTYLNKMVEWTDSHEMRLNSDKTKYMIINFCKSLQFQTGLHIDTSLLEQVHETRLL